MDATEPGRPERIDRTVIYESPWVNLYRDRVRLPTGRVLDQYHILDFGPGSVVVIVLNERREVLLERVARYPTGTTTWELPAGGMDSGETVVEAARREVLEETGYETVGHRCLYTYHPLNGISDTQLNVVSCVAGRQSGAIDREEIHAIRWFSLDELAGMVERREITDGLALVGVLMLLREAKGFPSTP